MNDWLSAFNAVAPRGTAEADFYAELGDLLNLYSVGGTQLWLVIMLSATLSWLGGIGAGMGGVS